MSCRCGAAALVVAVTGCQATRPQLLVDVWTDLQGAVAVQPYRLSPAAGLNRLRVEVLDEQGAAEEARDFLVDPLVTFPLSFGVAAPASGGPVRLRLTGFESAWVDEGGLPIPGVAVTRLFSAAVDTVQRVDLVLRGDCVGRPADPVAWTTCIDAARPAAPALDAADPTPASKYMIWPPSVTFGCEAPSTGTPCIAGGISVIGDPALVSVDQGSDLVAAPPRMVLISPFGLDQTEITVAEMRSIAATGALNAPLPTAGSADPRCNYSDRIGPADQQAVRCVSFATARAACRARGGDLPTAAQWEHVARSRGEEYRYPWGDDPPTCCAAALAAGSLGCTPDLDVGSHVLATSSCPLTDEPYDLIYDLAGSVREWVLDAPVGFDDCLPPGVATDPVCGPPGIGSTKGGSFATPLEGATLALRRTGDSSFDVGFRCAYPAQ